MYSWSPIEGRLSHRRAQQVSGLVALGLGRLPREQDLALDPRIEELAVRRAERLQVQRHHLSEVRRIVRRDHWPAARAGLQRDQSVDLENAQCLAERPATDPKALDHHALRWQRRTRLQVVTPDVLQDLARDRLRDLLGSLGHMQIIGRNRVRPGEARLSRYGHGFSACARSDDAAPGQPVQLGWGEAERAGEYGPGVLADFGYAVVTRPGGRGQVQDRPGHQH